jgi:hypothetical protein
MPFEHIRANHVRIPVQSASRCVRSLDLSPDAELAPLDLRLQTGIINAQAIATKTAIADVLIG